MADLIGQDYRACVEITTKAGDVVAAVGETCARVDPGALGWLLQCHAIEVVQTSALAAARPGDATEGTA